jgi:hypothetical protein
MMSCNVWIRNDIIHVAGRPFVKGVSTPSLSLNNDKCPFCNSDRADKTYEEIVEEVKKRVAAKDAYAIYILGSYYYHGKLGLQQDREKANELWKEAAALGSSHAHFQLGILFGEGGDLKKAKFHWEAAAMAGHERARCTIGTSEAESGNMERAVKHWAIAASAGCYISMKNDTL